MSGIVIKESDFGSDTNNSQNHGVYVEGHPTISYIRLLTASGTPAYKTAREAQIHVVNREPGDPIDAELLDENKQKIFSALTSAGVEYNEYHWCFDVHPDDLEAALVALGFDAPSTTAIMEHAAIANDKKFMFDANVLRENLVRAQGDNPDNLRAYMVETGVYNPEMIDAVVTMQQNLNAAAGGLKGGTELGNAA